MSEKRGRPKGSRNKPKGHGFYKLSPDQVAAHFADAPYILVSKDWLLNKIGDANLFDSFFNKNPSPTQEKQWKIQEL